MDPKRLVILVAAFWLAPAAHAEGPQCTSVYPRGLKVSHGTKKHPVLVCTNGDLGASWRICTQRYAT